MNNPDENKCAPIIDLAAVDSDGSFHCPKCGTSLSPDDETEEN